MVLQTVPMHNSTAIRIISYTTSLTVHMAVVLLLWHLWNSSEHDNRSTAPTSTGTPSQQSYFMSSTPIIFSYMDDSIDQMTTDAQQTATAPQVITQPAAEEPRDLSPSLPSDAKLHTRPTPTTNNSTQTALAQAATSVALAKPRINFAELAQGFLSRTTASSLPEAQESTHTAHADTIKFERFGQRVLLAIHNAFKLLKQSLALPYAPSGTTHITVQLANDGMVQHARITRASNNPYFDQFLHQVITQAGSMFPPLPAGLTSRTQEMTIIITITTNAAGGIGIQFSLAEGTV